MTGELFTFITRLHVPKSLRANRPVDSTGRS
jgi:hypothetical protein